MKLMGLFLKLKRGAVHLVVLAVVILVITASVTLLASDTDFNGSRSFEFISSLITRPCDELNCPKKKNPVSWQTSNVSLTADDFYIKVDGEKFSGNPQEITRLTSDPGNPRYTTLEVEWREKGKPMRLYIYFHARDKYWSVSEVRTYNGQDPGDWVYYRGFIGRKLGKTLKKNVFFIIDRNFQDRSILSKIESENFETLEIRIAQEPNWPPVPIIYFKNLRLLPTFRN